MSDVEDYLTANADFENVKKELSAMANSLVQFGTELSRTPERIYFSNSNVGLPMDIMMNNASKSYDAHQWPTPEKIQQAILRRFEAKRKVENAWSAIPQAMRASLVAPKI